MKFQNGDASCSITLLGNKTAKLTAVFSKTRGRGDASGLLRKVTEYADTNGLTLYLTARRYFYTDSIALTNKQLIEFYGKNGFVWDKGQPPNKMVRPPSQELHSL